MQPTLCCAKCQMNNQFFAHDNARDSIAISMAVIVQEMKAHKFQYFFLTMEEVPSRLADVCFAGMYAWTRQTMTDIAPEKALTTLFACRPVSGRQTRDRRKQ